MDQDIETSVQGIRMPHRIRDALDKRCRRENRTRHNLMLTIIIEALVNSGDLIPQSENQR